MIQFPYGQPGASGLLRHHLGWQPSLTALAAAVDGAGYQVLCGPENRATATATDPRQAEAALGVLTSGSTGQPRQVMVTGAALQASAQATADRIGSGHWLLALPPWRIAGLQVLLRAKAADAEVVAIDATEPFSPLTFAAASALLPAPRYVSLVPTQLHRLLEDPVGRAALQGFSTVLLGGAPAPPTQVRQARQAGVPVVCTYGMTETCGGCVYDGQPLTGVTVGLQSDRIWISGPQVALGYAGQLSDPAFPRPGTYRSADLGRWVGGRLEILGRADDVIISGGIKVLPQQVEQALGQLGVVCAVPDPEWGEMVVAVIPANPAHTHADLSILDRLPAEYCVRQVLTYPGALPMLGPGKPDRRAITAWACAQIGNQPSPQD